MPLRRTLQTARSWFADHIFKRLFKNASWLMAGNALSGVIGLGTMVLTARILDPAGFGLLALMTTYTGLIDRLLNFQTSQALIKYGTEALEHKDENKLRQLIKFCTCLDGCGAFFSTLVAMSGVMIVRHFLDLNDQQAHWLVLYSLVILFNMSGAPTAILRMFDRFYVLSFYKVASAVINLIGVGIVWYCDLGLAGFLAAMAIGQVIGQIILFVSGWRVLAQEKVTGIWKTSLRGITKTANDIWHFVIYTNIESSVKILRDVDIFIIKALLSNEAVGFYRIARKLAEVLNLIIDPFFYAIYPEFSKYAARKEKDNFKTLLWRSSMLVGIPMMAIWLGFLVLGRPFIYYTFGETYVASYAIALLCMLGTVSWGFFQPLAPALYSLGAFKKVFYIHMIVATTYIIGVALMVSSFGLVGAGLAFMMLFFIWGALSALALKHELKDKWNGVA